MKKFQFLLLDAGPIIGLFELGLWDKFIEFCNVTITKTIANQAEFFVKEEELYNFEIDLTQYERSDSIQIVDLDAKQVKKYLSNFDDLYKGIIHEGEDETLAYLEGCSSDFLLCAADKAVFKVLGLLGKGEQGISLEEILDKIGLSQKLKWEYTKKFRIKYTSDGQQDMIRGSGLKKS